MRVKTITTIAIFIVTTLLLTVALQTVGAQRPAAPAPNDNTELTRLFEEDRADRKPPAGKSIEWTTIAARHRARLARVKELYEQNRLQTATDYSRAALLLQQGDGSEDRQLARRLNQIAVSRSGGTVQPLQVGPEQDCDGAIRICQRQYVQSESYTGFGNVQEASGTCLSSGETNSVWYKFTAQTNGTFGFTINTPNDYDFSLYDITIGGCAGVPGSTPIRSNYSGTPGNTGLDAANVSSTTTLCNSASGVPIMPGVNVIAGHTYALLINNFTGDQNGYTLTFAGNASIFGPAPPVITGPGTACASPATYSVPDIPGVTYHWSITNGTLTNILNTSATANWSSSGGGTITVVAVNECGCARNTIVVQPCESLCCPRETRVDSPPDGGFVHQWSGVYTLTPILTAVPGNFTRVTATIISTSVTTSQCNGASGPANSYVVSAGATTGFTSYLPVPDSRQAVWDSVSSGGTTVSGQSFPFNIKFPPPPGFGCNDTLKFCVQYTLTDADCRTCVITRCYSFARHGIPNQ